MKDTSAEYWLTKYGAWRSAHESYLDGTMTAEEADGFERTYLSPSTLSIIAMTRLYHKLDALLTKMDAKL